MSASLPRAHGQPYAQHAVAVRLERGGYLYCAGCGASSVTRIDLAEAAGVTPYQLTRWLSKKPVAQGVADAIRRHLLRVEERKELT